MNTAVRNSSPELPLRRCAAKRPRHHVIFFCNAPHAESVRLVGDFNGWDLAATPMQRMPDGRWMASLELRHEDHQYLFVVDGEPTLAPRQTGLPATRATSLWIE